MDGGFLLFLGSDVAWRKMKFEGRGGGGVGVSVPSAPLDGKGGGQNQRASICE